MEIFFFMKRNFYCHENNFVKVYSNVCKALFYNMKSIGIIGVKVALRILFDSLICSYVVIIILMSM